MDYLANSTICRVLGTYRKLRQAGKACLRSWWGELKNLGEEREGSRLKHIPSLIEGVSMKTRHEEHQCLRNEPL